MADAVAGISSRWSNAVNAPAIVVIIGTMLYLVNDMRAASKQAADDARESAKANSLRIDAVISKAEERESKAWEQRRLDRELSLKHADTASESMRVLAVSMNRQTDEMTKKTEELARLNRSLELLIAGMKDQSAAVKPSIPLSGP
jgi:uncharacterized protein YdaU (DUF1376 family)